MAGEEHRDLAFLSGTAGPALDAVRRPQRLEELAGTMAAQILHEPVVGKDLHLIVRECDGEESVGLLRCRRRRPISAPRRARAALARAVVAVGDVQRGNRRERGDERGAFGPATRHNVCRTPSGASKS